MGAQGLGIRERMSRTATATKVGLFTVVLVVAGTMIYRFVNKGGSDDGYVVYAIVDDAVGISKLSQVRTAGIPIGRVQSIRLHKGKARIDIRVKDDVELFEDASVAKSSGNLLGEYFLKVAQGTEGRRKLKDGDQIMVIVKSATTDDVLQDVSKIAKKIELVASALADSIGSEEGKAQLAETLANLAEVTRALNETVRENRGAIRSILSTVERVSVRGEPEVQRILENVLVTTEEIRTLVAGVQGGEAGASGEVRGMIEKIDRASSSLERTLANLEKASDRLEAGEGTLGRLSNDEKLINEVEGVAQSVNSLLGGINRLKTIVVLRGDYQFRTSTVKTFVELRLQPREDKYYSIELINDPRGLTRIEQVDVDTTNPNDPPTYREIRSVTTNDFRFSLMFAQRFGPLVGRFGIKESTGGAGLDLLLLDDAFELRQDLFGFGETAQPRWRVSLGYAFVNRLSLLWGVDDILSFDRRDYFVGLQLKFNDEDIKTMLPFVPSP